MMKINQKHALGEFQTATAVRPMVRFASFSCAVFFSLLIFVSQAAGAQSKPNDPKDFRLLMSENDALCKPLRTLYSKISHYDRKVVNRQTGLSGPSFDWEDDFKEDFERIGLAQLNPVENLPDSGYAPLENPLHGLYKIRIGKNENKTFVYAEDGFFASGAQIDTAVYVLKPDSSVHIEDYTDPVVGLTFPRLAPDSLALAIAFGGSAKNGLKPVIEGPYFFKKIETLSQAALPIPERLWVVPNIGGSPGVVQRVYAFQGATYFIAHQSGVVLVYQIDNLPSLNDICYLASNGLLDGVLKYRK